MKKFSQAQDCAATMGGLWRGHAATPSQKQRHGKVTQRDIATGIARWPITPPMVAAKRQHDRLPPTHPPTAPTWRFGRIAQELGAALAKTPRRWWRAWSPGQRCHAEARGSRT